MEISGKASLRPVGSRRILRRSDRFKKWIRKKFQRRKSKSVALVAFGDSMDLMHELDENVEIWTLNALENYNFPRIDRAFEMHKLRDIVLETPRIERLKQDLPYPTYMLRKYPFFPSSVAYPKEAMLDAVFENIYLGNENAEYSDASLPYMMALVGMEGYMTCYVYGFGLRSDTEYKYQRPGAMLLSGWLAGKGCKVIYPEDSQLLPKTMYGYEDYQMISRQNLEQWLQDLQLQESDWVGKLNIAQALISERSQNGGDPEKLAEAQLQWDVAYKQLHMRAGAIHLCQDAIAILDRKQSALTEFEDRILSFEGIDAEQYQGYFEADERI